MRLALRSLPTFFPRRCVRRVFFATVAVTSTDMPVVKKEIALTTTERDLFEILRNTTRQFAPSVTLRCAGGWVRDKLLGRHSDDIDIAIDTMSGATFAEHVTLMAAMTRVRERDVTGQ